MDKNKLIKELEVGNIVKITNELKHIGISVKDENGNYRLVRDIINDVAYRYFELTVTEDEEISNILFKEV